MVLATAWAQDAQRTEASEGEVLEEGGNLVAGRDGWTARITVEGLVLGRDEATGKPLTKAGSTTRPFVPVNSSILNFDPTAGLRATVETDIANVPVELSGFFLSPIQGRALVRDLNAGTNITDAIYTNRDFPGGATFFRYSEGIYGLIFEQQTDFMGAEANLRDVFGVPGLLLGARLLYLSEKFSSSTHDRINDFPPNTGGRIDGLSIRSDNLLTGVQIGYQGMYQVMPGVSIGGSAKIGFYANDINVESTFTTLTPSSAVPSRSRVLKDGHDVDFSNVVELNPRLDWRISDGIVLTAAGTFLWISNVSEAVAYYADAANATPFKITDRGEAFFYGGSLGLRFELDKIGTSASEGGTAGSHKDGSGKTIVRSASPAEIEERIAELEASLVAKRSPAMSVNVTGQINKMLMWWSDGEQKDVYVVDNAVSGSRIGIEGEGRLSRALKAGYNLNFRLNDARSIDVSQDNDEGDFDESDLQIRYSEVWLQHNLAGRITIGQTSTATDDIINANLGGTGGVASADIALIGGGMFLRRRDRPFENVIDNFESTNTQTTMREFVRDLDTPRAQGIRWDSDKYYGFVVSAFWGENDFWDIGLTFARSWTDWRVRFRAGYAENQDSDGREGKTLITDIKGSAAVLHNPTGLFLNGAFLYREFDGNSSLVSEGDIIGRGGVVLAEGGNFADFRYYYLQGGIRRDWTSLGETSVFGEYAVAFDGLTGRGNPDSNELGYDRVTDSKLTMIGGGIVQEIKSANMEVYLGFRHFTYDTKGLETGSLSSATSLPPDAEAYEDLSIVYSGTRIRF